MRISDWSSDVCSSDLPQRATKRARVLITAQNIAGRACAMLACRRAGRMVSTYLKQFDVIDIWMTPTLGTEPVRIGVFSPDGAWRDQRDRKSTRLNSSH